MTSFLVGLWLVTLPAWGLWWLYLQLFTTVVNPYVNPSHPEVEYEASPRVVFESAEVRGSKTYSVDFRLHPEVGAGSECVSLVWLPRGYWGKFGYHELWFDGPHKSLNLGPVTLYWNFGPLGPGAELK